MAVSTASRSASRRELTSICALRIRSSRIVAPRMIPVSPIPPTVARNPSGSPSGVSRRTSPLPSRISISSIHRARLPSLRWFLPCTSAATAPPTVRWRVAGSTGSSRPSGTIRVSRSVKVVEAETRTAGVAGSRSIRGAVTGASTIPPAFWAASPWLRPAPRASTPPAGWLATRARSWPSGSGPSTRARDGVVRPQPLSSRPASRAGGGGHYSPPANSASQASSQQIISLSRAIRSSTGLAGWFAVSQSNRSSAPASGSALSRCRVRVEPSCWL